MPGHKAQFREVEMLESEIVKRISSLTLQNTENVRAVRREYTKRLAQSPPEMIVDLAVKLVSRSFLFRFIAYELVQHHKQAAKLVDAKILTRLGKGIDSWVAVDTFACYLAGPAWRERQVPDDLIHAWARSVDRWWRRTALVCTVPLNNKTRGGSGDVSRTLDICKMLVTDHDDMVVKAMSWALRELGKREPTAVRRFIKSHQKELAPRVIREVNNKLETGLKNPRKSAES